MSQLSWWDIWLLFNKEGTEAVFPGQESRKGPGIARSPSPAADLVQGLALVKSGRLGKMPSGENLRGVGRLFPYPSP